VAADALADRRRDRAAQALTRLRGKRVLITGGSSGIGLAAARLFADEGARLALLARGREGLEQSVRDARLDAVLLPVDITDRAAVEDAVDDAVAQLGGLDVLVANAAAGTFGHFLEVTPEDFDRAVDVTFRGSVNVVRAALPHLRASRGTIVATGSVVSRVPMPTWSSYTAGKHALRGFLNSLRIEEREQRTGVRVALVHPGVIDTSFWENAPSATGRKPRVPPDAYGADVVARALVESAVRPRRELVLGGVTVLTDKGFLLGRPVTERLLVVLDRWFRSGHEQASRPGSLWRATGDAQVGAGIPARESVVAGAQRGAGAGASGASPAKRLPRFRSTAIKAIELLGHLRGPVPERAARRAKQ
jgi:NAD(P)-dependent dehydrogenase (short-subunit alcohol dehydrogenase family)